MRLAVTFIVLLCVPFAAQAASPQFLPWPPLPPSVPDPPAAPPFVPVTEQGGPDALATTLERVMATIQDAMDRLWRWLDEVRRAAAGALTQVVRPLPAPWPAVPDPTAIIADIAGLSEQWRWIVARLSDKFGLPSASDTAGKRHAADIEGSPELSHEAAGIVAADEAVTSGMLQQTVAMDATAALAAAAVRDPALPGAVAAAQATADELIASAQGLPSARAGIEVLVAGTGAGLRHQASLMAALAGRVTALVQQAAQMSGQIGALASTMDAMAVREIERDRRALDARLGVADTGRGAAALLQRLLEGAGDPADEFRLVPIY